MKIIDTHCHLDSESFYGYLDEVMIRAKKANVEKIIIPGADINYLPRAVELSSRYNEVYYAIGVHPYDIDGYDEDELLRYNFKKCVGVGECGLDYFYKPDESVKKRQKDIFKRQINLALKLDKSLIIHTRDSNEDTYRILEEYKNDLKDKAVFHCYNACEMLLDFDFYFGIGGVLTFKNAKKLVEVLPKINPNKILLETDAPYLTPHPYRGKTNEPSYLTFVALKISELLNISYEEVLNMTYKNANKLFFGGEY